MRLRTSLQSPKNHKLSTSSGSFIHDWLNNRERILDSLLANLDGMAYCCLVDEHWTMLYVSVGCLTLTGYQAEDFLNNAVISYREVTDPDDNVHVRNTINIAVAMAQRFEIEYRIIKANGDSCWVLERGTGIFNDDGQLEAIEGFIQDINAHKLSEQALQDAEHRYRSIFENTVEGIFQTSPEGRYLSANPALARIYGFSSPEDLIGNMNDIGQELYVDPRKRDEFAELMLKGERVTNFESQIYRHDGSIIWISENARAVRDPAGQLLYYEGTVEDITEHKIEW